MQDPSFQHHSGLFPLRALSMVLSLHSPSPHQDLDLIPLTISSSHLSQYISLPSRPSDQDKGRARGSDLQSGRQNRQHQYLCLGRRGQPDSTWRHHSAHQRVIPAYSCYPRAVTAKRVELRVNSPCNSSEYSESYFVVPSQVRFSVQRLSDTIHWTWG